jgi:DNA-binding MarR family transcriptional regulator
MFSKSPEPTIGNARVTEDSAETPMFGNRAPRRGQGWQDALTWVQLTFRARRVRDQLFDANLFAEPAWDIMLDLYGAHLEGRPTTVADASLASSVPPATARRYIDMLLKRGLLSIGGKEADGDRRPVELTDSAKASMQTMFLKLRAMADSHPEAAAVDV